MDLDNTPATKADSAEVRQDIAALEQRMKAHSEGLEERMKAHAEAIVTRLLTAFHGWARSTELKLGAMPLLEQRLSVVEERVSRLERGELSA